MVLKQQQGNSQRRSAIRAISLFIILGTIPVYILLIGTWLFMPQNSRSNDGPTYTPLGEINGSSGDNGDSGGFATFTPLNADFLTQQDATQPLFFTPTSDFGGTFTYFTPDGGGLNLSSPTPPPTRYIPPTPFPTSAAPTPLPPTPIIAPTDMIAPTPLPPLAPPTDTPTA